MSDSSAVSLPQHIGFILDGNRRWAEAQGLPKLEGHRRGYDNLKTIVRYAHKLGVKYVSAYIFSTENWQRAQDEVTYLMDLALKMATRDVAELHKDNIRVRFLGRRDKISAKLLKAIEAAETKTKDNTGGTLALCFNYGGQQEIIDVAKHLVEAGIKSAAITLESFAQQLYAPDLPPLDLVVRTSGEQRLSNFMLWQAAYAELYFTTTHWPAFTTSDLDLALDDYAGRQRRFGAN